MNLNHKGRFCSYPLSSFSGDLRNYVIETVSGGRVLPVSPEECTHMDNIHLNNFTVSASFSHYAGVSVLSNPPMALPNNG
jgi:hypothetical protein